MWFEDWKKRTANLKSGQAHSDMAFCSLSRKLVVSYFEILLDSRDGWPGRASPPLRFRFLCWQYKSLRLTHLSRSRWVGQPHI
jgi:hypothetical protein